MYEGHFTRGGHRCSRNLTYFIIPNKFYVVKSGIWNLGLLHFPELSLGHIASVPQFKVISSWA